MTTKKKTGSSTATVMAKLGDGDWTPYSDDDLEKARKRAAAKKISIDVRPLTDVEKTAKPRSKPGV